MTLKKFYTISYALIILAIIVTVFAFVGRENDIYSFDYTLYWGKWERFSYNHFHNPLYDVGKIFSSLWKRDYNFLPVIIPSIFYYLPIPSRTDYILSISVTYLSTVIIAFSFLLNKIRKNTSFSEATFFSVLFPLTTAALWAPTLRGYPDIGGTLFVILALFCALETNLTKPQSLKRLVLLSFLLWFSFAFRRWYLYTVISLYVSIPISSLIMYGSKKYIDDIKNTVFNIAKSSLLLFAFLLVFQGKVIYKILTYHYGQAYSAYQMGFLSSLSYTIHHIGYFTLISALLGAILAFSSKNRTYMALASVCIINESISFLLFTHTQSPGVQHIIPFTLWPTCLACFFHMDIVSRLQSYSSRTIYTVLITIILSFSWYNSLFISKTHSIDSFLPEKNLPIHADNYQDYIRMTSDIKKILSAKESMVVLSSSYTVLNDTMVIHLLDKTVQDQILLTCHVDLRDGISTDLIKAHYILVVDPIQTHLVISGQRTVTIPANDLLHSHTIGSAFQKTPYVYTLNTGAKAFIYKKVRPISKEEISAFLEEFYIYYPQWRSSYSVDGLYMSQF